MPPWLIIPLAAIAIRAVVEHLRSLESDADRAVRESREETERYRKQNERLKRRIAGGPKAARDIPAPDPAPNPEPAQDAPPNGEPQ